MARYNLLTDGGTVLARGIYHLPHGEFMAAPRRHSLVPPGSFVVDRDIRRMGMQASPDPGLYCSHQDVVSLPRSDRWQGCCGPEGTHPNVLDPVTGEPIAYEFADCYGSHYIRVAPGRYKLVKESDGEPACLVYIAQTESVRLLVGVACGATRNEARGRLADYSEKIVALESEFLPPGASFQTLDARTFLREAGHEPIRWLSSEE